MKRAVPFSVIVALIISFAAPNGAVFASSEPTESASLEAALDKGDEPSPDVAELPGPAITSSDSAPLTFELVPLESETKLVALSEPVGGVSALESEPIAAKPAIVVAQIQVGAPGNSSDEYVSIYNNGSEVVDVTGWCLRNKNKVSFACLNGADTDYSINPGAYIGFSSLPDRVGEHGLSVRFAAGSNRIVASGDTIQLMQGDVVIDEIAWTVSPPSSYYAIERLWDAGLPGRLRVGNDSWSWKMGLDIYGRILGLVECSGGVMVAEGEQCPRLNACGGVVISEIAANVDDQFIELYNPSSSVVFLGGCQLLTNRSSKSFIFSEETMIAPSEFVVVFVADTDLTLTKTTSGTVRLLSSDGLVEVDAVSYRDLVKGTSWALMGDEWVQTYSNTPGGRNVYEQYLPCEEGYWRNISTGRCNQTVEPAALADCGEGRERNPETGRCRTTATASVLTPCREGQYRSEETNRCRSIATAAASVLKPCADGQFRNPETNRCKKIASDEDVALADCGEGRERNPATNRCRNVVTVGTLADTLPFPVEHTEAGAEHFVGWWTLGIVAALGAGYGAWEWREELLGIGQRAVRFIARSK